VERRFGYKVLDANGGAIHGRGQWKLPQGRKFGEWMPLIADPVLCRRGYHFCRDATDLLAWLGDTVWIVEVRGAVVEGDNKAVAAEARLIRKVKTWDERTARLFACACAKHVLKHADPKFVDVKTLKKTIRVAELFALGKATEDERSAARSAAESVARIAAESAAESVARIAAESAVRSAAESAVRSAEKKWQARKLAQMLSIKVRP
jgi:hypothetical protein